MLTRGFTNSEASSVFKLTVGASAQTYDPDYGTLLTDEPIPVGDITLCGKTPNSNGVVYVTFPDNSTNDITPVINSATYPHYTFGIAAERIKITLTVRTSDKITKPDDEPTIGIGFDPTKRLAYVLTSGDDLGVSSFYSSGQVEFMNGVEISGQLPEVSELLEDLEWHRESNALRYWWNPNSPNTFAASTSDKLFNQDTPFNPAGNGNDSGGGASDDEPDTNRSIFSADAPSMNVTNFDLTAPLGSIAALRFSAREWVTWNGAIISNVATWHSFVTVKKVGPTPGWVRTGSNEIEEGENTEPFTTGEAQGL